MDEAALKRESLFRPRRVAGQALGFLIGLGLIGVVAWTAFRGEDQAAAIARLREANPWLIAAMAGCSLASAGLNGATFWLVIRPKRAVGLWNMERLNLVGNALNYTPMRLGLIARLAYHRRVDGLGFLAIGAWFAAIAMVLGLVMASYFFAVMSKAVVGAWWPAVLVAALGLGGVSTKLILSQPFVKRYAAGVDEMLGDPAVLWGAIGLRAIDILAFAGRAAAAMAIVGLPVESITQVVFLALVAFAAGFIPIRLGFREAAVGLAAAYLAMDPESLASSLALFALIESAGEAIVFLPGGALGLPWYWRRMRRAKGERNEAEAGADDAPGGVAQVPRGSRSGSCAREAGEGE